MYVSYTCPQTFCDEITFVLTKKRCLAKSHSIENCLFYTGHKKSPPLNLDGRLEYTQYFFDILNVFFLQWDDSSYEPKWISEVICIKNKMLLQPLYELSCCNNIL